MVFDGTSFIARIKKPSSYRVVILLLRKYEASHVVVHEKAQISGKSNFLIHQ
jgi:hypothetical protein